MTSGLIQYTWTVEERRKDRIKQAFYDGIRKIHSWIHGAH